MVSQLPPADWTEREDLARLVTALGAENMRWVGGAVRDTLLGAPVNDIDAATTLHPDIVMGLCKEADIRTVPTGLDHGTVTAVLPEGAVEITTLRHDVSTDGRRAIIRFAKEWRDDAARRDFTINALFAHPQTLAIDDYFGGLLDLSQRRVRFIGDARDRIREDHLRILRYYRFQARFGSALNDEAEEACAELADTMKGLSRERVAGELLAILALPDPGETVARMHARGVLPVILPEAGAKSVTAFKRLIAAEKAAAVTPDPIRRLAALLPALPEIVQALTPRLRLSRAHRERLICAAERQPEDAENPRALAYNEGIEGARDRLLLQGAEISEIANWEVPRLPLKGGEIVARGVGAGPEVSRILRAVERRWVSENFPPRERVEQMLDDVLES